MASVAWFLIGKKTIMKTKSHRKPTIDNDYFIKFINLLGFPFQSLRGFHDKAQRGLARIIVNSSALTVEWGKELE